MKTLSPRARRRTGDLDDEATHEQGARHVVELVESWGLPRDRRSHDPEDVASWFDNFDRSHARTVAEVWARR